MRNPGRSFPKSVGLQRHGAVATRGGRRRGTILHSDRGGESTAHLTARACFRHGLRRSMGATGICWDNSPAESFWSTFKHEEYYWRVYATKAKLIATVDKLALSTTVRDDTPRSACSARRLWEITASGCLNLVSPVHRSK